MTVSGLSQRVVCNDTPYSIRIVKRRSGTGWRASATDMRARRTIWTGTADDDAHAFLEAMQQIHSRAAGQAIRRRPTRPPSR